MLWIILKTDKGEFAVERKINLFIVDDEMDIRRLLVKSIPENNYNVATFASGEEFLKSDEIDRFDVGLVDIKMAGMSGIDLIKELKKQNLESEIIVLTGNASIETAIEALKLGAYDYLSKPFILSEIELIVKRAYEKKELIKRNEAFKDEIMRIRREHKIIGESEKIKEILILIQKVAPAGVPVLIQGESGTGKELAAMAIHDNSQRNDKPYIVIDCSSLQDTLLENELFGHEKGSFTDAFKEKKGLFEIADKGTLFLDEIGEMSKNIQSKLLRVLETKKFRRIGGTKEINVDVRVIAATNRNLEEEVKEGRFRKDLYYRLNVVTLEMPPLRERQGDIPILVDHLLKNKKITNKRKKKISKAALEMLEKYQWPGNIRELINVVERALIFSDTDTVIPEDLNLFYDDMKSSDFLRKPDKEDLNDYVDEAERDYIIQVLKQSSNSKTKAAKTLKVSRATLYRKLKKYGLL
jgi:DNA-binding NtrC family response regulator